MPSHLVSSSVCPRESRVKLATKVFTWSRSTKSQGSGALTRGNLSKGGRMRAVFWSQYPMKRKLVSSGEVQPRSGVQKRSPAGCALAEAQANNS